MSIQIFKWLFKFCFQEKIHIFYSYEKRNTFFKSLKRYQSRSTLKTKSLHIIAPRVYIFLQKIVVGIHIIQKDQKYGGNYSDIFLYSGNLDTFFEFFNYPSTKIHFQTFIREQIRHLIVILIVIFEAHRLEGVRN